MTAISLLALVVVLSLLALAAGVPAMLRWLSERRRRQVRRAAHRVAAGAIGMLLVVVSVTVPNVIRSDAVDRLPSKDRTAVRAAVRSAPGCSTFTLIAEVRPSTDLSPRHGFHYRCEWTILGWPTITGEASCTDGEWVLPGYLEPRFTSEPCGYATGSTRQ